MFILCLAMSSKHIHVVAWIRLLFTAERCCVVWRYRVRLSILPLMDVGFFPPFGCNHVAVNIGIYVPGSESCFLVLVRVSGNFMFSTGDAPFDIPTQSVQSFQFPIFISLCQPKVTGVNSMPIGILNLGCSGGNFIQCKQPPWD